MTVTAPCGTPGASMAAEFEPGIAYHDVRLTDYQTPAGCQVTGLDAVDQWSVGFYKGGTFYAQASTGRRKQAPALEEMLQLPQLRGVPAILISDVYGNRSLWIQEDHE